MNLAEIRQWFIQESGRYELVIDTTTWADNGANRYIQAGQRMLDHMLVSKKSLARNFQMVTAGVGFVTFQNCRAIKEVWAAKAGEGRWKLEKKSLNWLRETYANLETIENGKPLYYAPAVLRSTPELHIATISSFVGLTQYLDVMYDNHNTYNGVIFFPFADGDTMIETWGSFYSNALTSDSSESWWSVNYPELLTMAAQCVLEKFSRNTQGVNDWILAIKTELAGIDLDMAEEESAEIRTLGG